MKLHILPFLVIATLLGPGSIMALDLAAIAENNAAEFRQAVEADGGTVGGEPYVSSVDGPGGAQVRAIVFPSVDSYITLPVNPPSNHWTLTGAIHVEEWPFEKAAGAVFGVLFGTNDYVLGLGAGKWSKAKALFLLSGLTNVIEEQELQEAGVPATGAWQKIVLGLEGEEYKLQIGDSFRKSGPIVQDGRAALTRRSKLTLRLGTFRGAATLPVLSEVQ
jgi:hypothetical protein